MVTDLQGDKRIMCHMLLDTGAGVTLLTRRVARFLQLDGEDVHLKLDVAAGGKFSSMEKKVSFRLLSIYGEALPDGFVGITTKSVSAPGMALQFDPRDYYYLKEEPLTMSYPMQEKLQLDVILNSADSLFLVTGLRMPPRGERAPMVVYTKLGNALGGWCPFPAEQDQVLSTARVAVVQAYDKELLRRFADMEDMGIEEEDGEYTQEEQRTVDYMRAHTTYDEEKKRYTTRLTWLPHADPDTQLDDNVGRALAVCRSFRRKYESRPELLQAVDEAYKEQLNLGMARIVPKGEWRLPTTTYTIPSHPVIREESTTHKVRIVQNASCACQSTGKSLNDLLACGPVLIPPLIALILQFRLFKYAVVLDISRMFWNLRIAGEDQRFLRYMWQFLGDTEATMIESEVLTFGLVSAPFQAVFTILLHCEKFAHLYPKAVAALRERLYVDDASGLANQRTEVVDLTREIWDLLLLCSMIPHKFQSNDKSILREAGIPEERWASKDEISYLGMSWNTETDEVTFDLSKVLKNPKVHTKRTLASEMASVFDPLGLISPVVCQAKLLFQQSCLLQTDWDDPLEDPVLKDWLKWRSEIAAMPVLRMPRLAASPDDDKYLALFHDASSKAYAVVAYACDKRGGHIVMSKSKLAPSKISMKEARNEKMSIARLELLSAVLASKVARYILNTVPEGTYYKTVFFTDSLVTLYRIRRGPQAYKAWVANRLKGFESRGFTSTQFHYVPGNQNPADVPSRAVTMVELSQNYLWFNGPRFLADHSEESWPELRSLSKQEVYDAETQAMLRDADELEAESRVEAQARAVMAPVVWNRLRNVGSGILMLYHRTNCWAKRSRITAVLLKFVWHVAADEHKEALLDEMARASAAVYHLQMVSHDGQKEALREALQHRYVSAVERHVADYIWIRILQTMDLPDAEGLQEVLKHPEKIKGIKEYAPFIGDFGLMRMRSRLRPSTEIPPSVCYPIILPKRNRLTDQLVLYIHESNGHATKQASWFQLRKHFKVLGGKPEVYRILKKCPDRYCNPPRPLAQPWAPLPPDRIEAQAHHAWRKICIDFAGPVYTHHTCKHDTCPHRTPPGKLGDKNYILVLADFYTRSVELQLCVDLSTKTFLQAFTKHCAAHGWPSVIFSDNATTFKAADKELKQFYKDINAVVENTAAKGVVWRWGLPAAPHGNGIIEILVKATKRALRDVYHRTTMPRHELQIQLDMTACLLNERPLVAPSERIDDEPPITPNLLDKGRSYHMPPLDPDIQVDVVSKLRAQRLQEERRKLQKSFWRRWQRQYLFGMRVRQGAKPGRWPEPKVGQVVLLHDPQAKLNEWRLAVVEGIKRHQGDGLIREVTVRTTKGILRRHIKDIAFMECDIPDVNPLSDEDPMNARGGKQPTAAPADEATTSRPSEEGAEAAADSPPAMPPGPLTRARKRAMCKLFRPET